MTSLPVYALRSRADESVAVQTDLEYFQTHFVGEPMAKEWTPPPLTVLNKSKRLKDFISFALCAPTVSERAMTALKPLIGPFSEFLPLIRLKNVDYYAINVLLVVDCVDRENSRILYSPHDPDRILTVSEYRFIELKIPDAPIFKALPWTEPFVRRDFVDCVIDNLLTNAIFRDPAVCALPLISRGQDINVVPYVPL